MFEFIAILFIILAILSSVLQASKTGGGRKTNLPTGDAKTLKHERAIMGSERPKLALRKPFKIVLNDENIDSSGFDEPDIGTKSAKPTIQPIKADISDNSMISLDSDSVLKGIIFSVILSKPKCKQSEFLP